MPFRKSKTFIVTVMQSENPSIPLAPLPKHPLGLQEKILQTFGLISQSTASRWATIIYRILGCILIAGAWTSVTLQLGNFICRMQTGGFSNQLSHFLTEQLPYITAMIRGTVLVCMAYAQPGKLRNFLHGINHFLASWSRFRPVQASQRRGWRLKTAALLVVLSFSWACWEAGAQNDVFSSFVLMIIQHFDSSFFRIDRSTKISVTYTIDCL